MLSRRLLLSATAGVLLPLGRSAAEAPPEHVQGAARFVSWLGEQAIALLRTSYGSLEEREQAFRALLSQGLDVPFISRFVLGNYWRQVSAEQQQDYSVLFREFLLKTYSRRLGGYSGESFAVTGARPAGRQDVIVQTRIARPGAPAIIADWRVRVIDQQYKIIDVAVEGVSMAVTQRAEFATVIQNHGMEGLLQALRMRTQTYSAKAS